MHSPTFEKRAVLGHKGAAGRDIMRKLSIILVVILLGSAVSGCSKCGFWWQEGPRACKDDVAPR